MSKLLLLPAIISIFSLIPLNTDAQIRDMLKQKANSVIKSQVLKEKAKKLVINEMEDIRSEYDSSSFNYAIALSDNAGLFESKEKHEKYQKFTLEYINRKEGDLSDEDQARAWVDRAEILYANGKYKLAAGMLIAAKALYEENYNTHSIEYAKVLANISLVSHSLGRYNFAIKFGEQSLVLREKLFGKDSRAYAASLNNIAMIKKSQGFYNESEKMLTEAVEKNRVILGENSMGYAITLNNLASLNQSLGRYEEAERGYKKALSIAITHLREKSGNYQQLQTNLALLYQDMGRYEEAEQIYLDAISVKKKRMSESHPDYAHLLRNLASLYMLMEKYDEVENLLKKSLNIYQSKFGENSPATADAISDFGNYYVFMENFNRALPLVRQAQRIRRDMLGEKHPKTIQSTEDLAIVQWKTGHIDQAVDLYTSVLSSTYNMIDEYFVPMSEHEKSRFWSMIRPRINRFYSFVYSNHQNHPDLLKQLIVLQTSTKALLMNSSNKIRQSIMNGNDAALKENYEDWLDQKELLANYYTYSKEELREEKINLDSLERKANESERFLSENSPVFKEGFKPKRSNYDEIKNSLSSGELLLEVIHSQVFTHKLTADVRYLFLGIRSDEASPKLFTAENGTELENRYFKYYNNSIRRKMDDNYSYDQYIKPFNSALSGISRIYISPDGIYNQINLNSIKNSDSYFIQNFELVSINNPGDLVGIKGGKSSSMTKKALLIGYPEYGGTGKVSMLPGTKTEVENISRMMMNEKYKLTKLLGTDANELKIKSLSPEGFVHIATHGYFLKNVNKLNDQVFGISTEKANTNPLLRSGLMFTGAGYAVEGKASQDFSGSNEGLLTAYEAMNMNLESAELVVLSACETATGDIQSGEGVYGLQRAFIVAGANALIMSLWKVDDTATQKLMTLLYQNIIKGMGIEKAFHQAQLNLMKSYPHPYFWGAFVFVKGGS